MTNKNRRIVVLTPVKNEAWILDRFLKVCSIFADHIIIADQNSTDGSLDIYPKYPKVELILNKNKNFNEAERQELLINKARELFGTNNILLAIDADEILAADALGSEDWISMLNAEPGTILYFEKPTFYKNTSTVIRYDGGGWPLGFVDDGSEHVPSQIHSTRIPTPKNAPKLYLTNIKFLHYTLTRLDAQTAKFRMYCILENIKNTKNLRLRLRTYYNIDFSKEGSRHEESNKQWFERWEELGIDMHSISCSDYYWYDYESLKLLKEYGLSRFAFDNIWNFDWEKFRDKALSEGYKFVPDQKIKRPNALFSGFMCKCIFYFDKAVLHLKSQLK